MGLFFKCIKCDYEFLDDAPCIKCSEPTHPVEIPGECHLCLITPDKRYLRLNSGTISKMVIDMAVIGTIGMHVNLCLAPEGWFKTRDFNNKITKTL